MAAITALVGLGAFSSVPSFADEAGPILVVPASPSLLHVEVDLPKEVKLSEGDAWQLTEIGGPATVVPAQLLPKISADGAVENPRGSVAADIPPQADATGPRRFRLEPSQAKRANGFQFADLDASSLKLLDGDKPVYVYNHGVITNENVPKSDKRRSRACYFHPVWGLNGEILTDDFPRDHYHHHGIFWAWPHVGIGEKQYDLWMGKDIQQRFVRWLARESGPVAAVLGVENGWFMGEKKVMIERVWMKCHRAASGQRSLDLSFAWIPVDQPITLRGAEGKSYGGLTVRFAVKNSKKSTITVPSGVAKGDLPETPLPWADLTYTFADMSEPSGAALFVPKNHPDYPPTWLTRHYGPQCIGWPGVKDRTFEPGKPIELDYRMWVHQKSVGVETLKQAYDAYLAADEAKWE